MFVKIGVCLLALVAVANCMQTERALPNKFSLLACRFRPSSEACQQLQTFKNIAPLNKGAATLFICRVRPSLNQCQSTPTLITGTTKLQQASPFASSQQIVRESLNAAKVESLVSEIKNTLESLKAQIPSAALAAGKRPSLAEALKAVKKPSKGVVGEIESAIDKLKGSKAKSVDIATETLTFTEPKEELTITKTETKTTHKQKLSHKKKHAGKKEAVIMADAMKNEEAPIISAETLVIATPKLPATQKFLPYKPYLKYQPFKPSAASKKAKAPAAAEIKIDGFKMA